VKPDWSAVVDDQVGVMSADLDQWEAAIQIWVEIETMTPHVNEHETAAATHERTKHSIDDSN
jgi:hypothetical protein